MMIRIEMKNYNTILTEMQQKHQQYQVITGKEIIPPDQRREIEQAKFTCSPKGKTLEK